MLLFLFLLSLGLGHVLDVQHQSSQRQKEAWLLYTGKQYQQAIRAYYLSSPGTVKRYPDSLNDLLLDKRWLTTRRYLRRLYPDPMTTDGEWGLIPGPGATVMGVYSLAEGRPIKQANFPAGLTHFENADSYRQWRFVNP